MLTFGFRLPPGPHTADYAVLAERLGYERAWCPEIPAYGYDIWVALSQVAERTSRIGLGAAVLVPGYRHPLAQASAIATLEHLAPGRLWAGFGTGFTGRAGLGLPPHTLSEMRRHVTEVRGLLRGEPVALSAGGVAQLLAVEGWLPQRPIRVPLLLASQGPKGRALAHEVADGLISLGAPQPGFERCLVSVSGTVFDDDEDEDSPRVRTAAAPLVASAYHGAYARDPESVRRLPNGDAWLESVRRVPEEIRHLSVHRGHALTIDNEHDALIDLSVVRRVTFSGTRSDLRTRLAAFEAAGATGIIFGTSGADVQRELHAFADVAGLPGRRD